MRQLSECLILGDMASTREFLFLVLAKPENIGYPALAGGLNFILHRIFI